MPTETDDDRRQQILQVHAELIHTVVRACENRDLRPPLEEYLQHAIESGWENLVRAIRLILDGRRDPAVLEQLDEEDRVIVTSILLGLQNPDTLPDPDAPADAAAAAPGLAQMIHMARRGDAEALQTLANMGEQMSTVGGDMARIAGTLRALIDGERDADRLAVGMGAKGKSLLLSIIEELGKLDAH